MCAGDYQGAVVEDDAGDMTVCRVDGGRCVVCVCVCVCVCDSCAQRAAEQEAAERGAAAQAELLAEQERW
jgi:hypothetical protein